MLGILSELLSRDDPELNQRIRASTSHKQLYEIIRASTPYDVTPYQKKYATITPCPAQYPEEDDRLYSPRNNQENKILYPYFIGACFLSPISHYQLM